MSGLWFRNKAHYPRPISPLAATTIFPAMAHGLRHGGNRFGLELGTADVRVHEGWSYEGWANARDLEGPPPGPEVQARMGQALGELPDAWRSRFLPELEEVQARIRRLVPTDADDAQAAADLRTLDELVRRTWEIHFEAVMPLNGGFLGIAMMLQGAGVPNPWETAANLVGAADGGPRWPETDLRALAALAESDPALASLVDAQDAEGLVTALEVHEGEAGERFRRLWPSLAELSTSFDPFDPTWGEDPQTLLRALAGGAEAADLARQGTARAATTQKRAEAEVLARLPAELHGPFQGMLGALRRAWFLFEGHNVVIDQRGTGLLRLAYLRAGERLVRRGLLGSPQEVGFLTAEEVQRGLTTDDLPPGLADERRSERAQALERDPPTFLGTPTEAFYRNPQMLLVYGLRPDEAPETTTDGATPLSGIPASPGTYRGRARVVHDESTLEDLVPGEVFVGPTSQPSWTMVMTRAGAIVAESGGMLCHAATLAREFGLPGVVSVTDATRRIRTGDLVEVDGGAGTVTIIGD